MRLPWIFFCIILLAPMTLFAGEKVCDDTNPNLCSQPVTEGETVPFSGQLLTTELAISIGQKAEKFDIQLGLELSKQKKLLDIDLTLEKKLHDIDVKTCNATNEILEKSLKKATSQSWYQQPVFIVAATFVATTVIFVGAAWILSSVSG